MKGESKVKKTSFKSGVGESLEFAAVFPIILAVILFVIAIFQVTICEEKLTYAAYMGGRAAVISFDKETAETNAEETIDQIMGDDPYELKISPDNITWEKGNVALIQVAQDLEPIFPYQKGKHIRQIAMMIEHSHWVSFPPSI